MKRTLASFLAVSSLALGLAAPAALAQPAEPARFQQARGGPHGHHGGERWLRRLDLTEAQRDQVFKIFHEQAPARREQMKAARSASQELREAALAPSFDRARAQALAEAHARALAALQLMRAESMSRVFALLTPEQRDKLQQMRRR